MGPQEDIVAAKQSQNLKSITGAILLALGFLVLFANLDAVASQISSAAGLPGETAPGVLPALILATVHAVQSYVFDHAGFLSGILQILVSFWPVILVIIGLALLRDAFRSGYATKHSAAASSTMGDR
jgi:hypothetical protein